jgi:tetratricopeptide (TPR) repeat protein
MDRTGFRLRSSLPLALLLGAVPLAAFVRAQDPPPAPVPAPAAEEAVQEVPATPLEMVKKATPEELPKALRAFVEDQIGSQAVFAGQYAALRGITGVEAQFIEWISRPPQGSARTPFRIASVRATRDLVEKASEELLAKLGKIAGAGFEAAELRAEASYALAQFGQRQLVEARLAEIEKASQSEDPAQKAGAFQALAEMRYNLREYPAAAAAHESFLALVEGGKLPIEESNKPTMFYNAACSHALAGDKEKALARLQNALDAWKKGGAVPRRLLETDMDIQSLRGDAKFQELMAAYLPPAAGKKAPASKAPAKPADGVGGGVR